MNSDPHRPAEESRPKVAQARRLAQSREDNRQAGPLPQTASDAKALPSSGKIGRKRKGIGRLGCPFLVGRVVLRDFCF